MPDPQPGIGNLTSDLDGERKLALFQAVFDEMPDVIVLKDDKGDFLLCNQTVARLYNTTPEQMVGKHDDDFGVPKALADGFRDNVLGIMARGETEVVFEDSCDATTGELRHFKSIKRPFKDAQGRNQILVIAHDITDVVRAQQQVALSEQRLQEVMTATQEGVWDWHLPSGKIVHNERWFSILGFDEGEIVGHVDAFAAHLHAEDRRQVWERLQRVFDGTEAFFNSEHRMVRKDGSVIWVQDRGRVVERDARQRPLRVVGAYADITERKRNQVALEHALDMAQSATQAKSDFLATMSHELRTPMNGVLGMAQLLQMPGISEADRLDYAQTIVSSGQTLLALLNNILDLSKIEAGHMDLERQAFGVLNLLQDTVKAFEEPARRKGLSVSVDTEGLLSDAYMGDALKLRQMVSNYLGNAIKFTHEGNVTLKVAELLDSAQQPMLEFSVIDSGVGIALNKQALLFKPFTQADSSTTREFGGTGLGLSIVARMAELMGGRVGLDSEPGVGSRFWFRVPAESAAGAKVSAAPPGAATTNDNEDAESALSGHLLVAEDNPVNRMVIGALLGNLGLTADFAEDGQAALTAVMQGTAYRMILMDIQMPTLDGLEATRRIRQWESVQGVPRHTVVALTAGAFEGDRQKCMDAGMDDFLAKPIHLASLSKSLRYWLNPARRATSGR
jgi:PAS domain S-box-containing protein